MQHLQKTRGSLPPAKCFPHSTSCDPRIFFSPCFALRKAQYFYHVPGNDGVAPPKAAPLSGDGESSPPLSPRQISARSSFHLHSSIRQTYGVGPRSHRGSTVMGAQRSCRPVPIRLRNDRSPALDPF